MNRIDFTQTGGFPFDQSALDFLQTNANNAAKTAYMAGALAILTGCVVTGSNVSAGTVVINGEILPFVAGVVQAKVIVVETATKLTYQDGNQRQVKFVRVAQFGDDGVQNNPWANFKRNTTEGVLARLDRVEKLLLPFSLGGGMLLWNRPFANIPTGWREVTDWRGRLPMGYNPSTEGFDVGDTGGAGSVEIVRANLPNETLEIDVTAGDSSTTDSGSGRFASGNDNVEPTDLPTLHTEPLGEGLPLVVLNPYRIVVFIEPIPGSF